MLVNLTSFLQRKAKFTLYLISLVNIMSENYSYLALFISWVEQSYKMYKFKVSFMPEKFSILCELNLLINY
jgi:hypothetical protein